MSELNILQQYWPWLLVVAFLGIFPFLFAIHVSRLNRKLKQLATEQERELAELILSETALRENEERYRMLSESASDVIWAMDMNLMTTYASPSVEQLLGYSSEEFMKSRTIEKIMSPESLNTFLEYFAEELGIEEGEDKDLSRFTMLELEQIRKDGSTVWTEVKMKFLRDHDNQATGILGITRDISERKQAEKELLRITKAVESSSDAIGLSDPEGHHFYQNRAFTELFEYATAEELESIGGGPGLYAHQDVAHEVFENIKRGVSWLGESEMVSKSGRRFPVFLRSDAIKDDRGNIIGLIGVHTDITERKQAEDALKGANQELEEAVIRAKKLAITAEEANAAKGDFLANMSHEIRTPMNGIIGMIGLLLDTALSNEQTQYAETVRNSADSLLNIINDILDFSKIEAGKLELETLDFDLRATLEDTTDPLALRIQEKGLEFICMIDPEIPSLVKGDPGRLRQVLTNLLGNAIKFTSEGEVSVKVTPDHEDDNHVTVRFEVTDTGIGIPADKVKKLFQAFMQADASTTRRFGGTGLGLSISKLLAEMMGGRIGVESKEGAGSTFWFTVVFEKQPVVSKQDLEEHADITGVRILSVDDNATNRRLLSVLLDSWGCRNSEAPDAKTALETLHAATAEGDPFRIAILDMHMPGMNGETLGRKIKENPEIRNTTLIMMTSIGNRGDARRLEDIGFSAYLTKPLKQSQLYDCLLTVYCGKKRSPDKDEKRIVTRHTLAENRRHKVRILIVEDNIVNQKVAMKMVEKLGFRADAVADGWEALQALETIPYDLVLMDCQMPELDGYEATRRIRNPQTPIRNPKIPIIAMTAHAMQGDREKCLNAGMDDYISKPVNANALCDVLDKYIADDFDEIPVASAVPVPDTSQSAPVNMSRIHETSDGDHDFEKELIEIFLTDNEQRLTVLEIAVNGQDADAVKREAHTMKGSCSNMGAQPMQEIAYRLEQSGLSGELGAAVELLSSLKSEFDRTRTYLQDYIDDEDGGTST